MKKGITEVFVVLILAALLVGIYLVYSKNYQLDNSRPQSTNSTKSPSKPTEYKSKIMNFTIVVPKEYEIEDKLTVLDLKTSRGKISIIRNGTEFENLNDYITQYDSRRNLSFSNVEKITINDLQGMSRVVTFEKEKITQKSYYIYSNYFVFIISAENESLYSDLDQIAQSFHYTP